MLEEDKLRNSKLATTELSFASEEHSLKFLHKCSTVDLFRKRVNKNNHVRFSAETEQLQDLITGSHERIAFKFCF